MKLRPMFRIMFVAALIAARAQGQSLPADFENLPASQFVDAGKAFMEASIQPTPQQFRALVELAWSRFLDKAAFIANADWPVVSKMAAVFGNQTAWLGESSAGTPAERVAAFRAAIKTRLGAQPAAEASIEDLITADEALEAAGLPRSDLAPRAVEWTRSNNWQQLPLPQRIRLANLLHVERIPVQSFSVRWTGFLTPPANGEYVFEQLRQHHIDGVIKVTLGGQLVLDSATNEKPIEGNGGRVQVKGEPITLAAGERLPLLVEFRYDAESMRRSTEFAERIFPMAVVLWTEGDKPAEIIPPNVFSSPGGVASELQGEYFSGSDFEQPMLSRTDPGLQMIWSEWQVASQFPQEQALITESCLETIHAGGMSDLTDRAFFMESVLPKLLKRLPALERAAIVAKLAEDAEGLRATTPYGVRSLFRHLFMLPTDLTQDFFIAWVENRAADVNMILPYPGWGPGSYMAYAYDDYGWVGHFLRGANWPIAESILAEYLERDDGSCNLMAAYCVIQGAVLDQRPGSSQKIREVIDAKANDQELSGDRRASWLMARAFFDEVRTFAVPDPLLGVPHLVEAALVAESNDVKYRIFQETAARLGSADSPEIALSYIERAGKDFQSANQVQEQGNWKKQIEALADARAKLMRQAEEAGQEAYVSELERRRRQAESGVDDN